MYPVNPKKVFMDLEELIGTREMLRHCSEYIDARSGAYIDENTIYPLAWSAACRAPLASDWDSSIDKEMVNIEMKYIKKMTNKMNAPGAPKKPRAVRVDACESSENVPMDVCRSLNFMDDRGICFSPLHVNII
jgi:hypothetical protein